ncbi:class I SAM-dependent RNA methyltransferase [Proteinivorax hydrogeniformans]|uniref:Class I SAM-dependent RNA methyltransferase n=1 Tax=Proteinivorax hydrogeniformans TaxID=1826727 RepID=A0AAU8HVS5_9FIRM
MMKIELIATSTFGLESIVADEVEDLGYKKLSVENGKVTFLGDEKAICRSNLWLRVADRVKIKMGEFKATTFEELFEQTKALPWEWWITQDAKFPVEGKSIKSKLYSVSDCQAIVKKAVVDRLKDTYGDQWFSEEGPTYKIEVSILKDTVTLSIDTTGPGLHKRGYRTDQGKAPIKETLAAAMLKLAKYNSDRTLIDPFCGSGTICIEAAMIGQNIAPGMNREFVSESWENISKKSWKEARKETHDVAEYDKELSIQGYDIDGRVTKIAQQHISEAMLDDVIHIQKRDVKDLSSKDKYGMIVTNPPYGERIGEKEQVEELYRTMGDVFSKLDTWSFYVLTSNREFEELFGKEATKRRKLYNGRIACQYYQYYGPKPGK